MSKYSELPRDTVALLSKRACATVIVQDYIDWAVKALIDGFDSPNLVGLAILEADAVSPLEASNCFLKVVQELSLSIPECELLMPLPIHHHWQPQNFIYQEMEASLPNWEAILRRHLDELAEQIIEGLIDPVTAVNRIHTEVVNPLGHPLEISEWCYLWETISSAEGTGTNVENSRIIAFATQWLETKGTSSPANTDLWNNNI